MSQEHVEALKAVYERWSEGDFHSSVDVFDPLVLFVMRPEFPDAGAYFGTERLAEYTRGFLEPWARITIEAEAITDAGDSVIVAVRQRGVGAESGAGTEFGYFHVWTFRGGKVIRLESIRERPDALEAAGISEQALVQENVENVRGAYEAFARGDLGAVLNAFDPNVISYTAPPLPDPAEYHGREGVLQWIGNWTEGFDEFAMEAEEYIDAGDRVVVGVHQRATGAGSGVPVERRFWLLHTLRNGKVTRIGVYATRSEALEAAEPPD